jgi:hypothetical protein
MELLSARISDFQSVYQFSVTVDYEVGVVCCKNGLAIELCFFTNREDKEDKSRTAKE